MPPSGCTLNDLIIWRLILLTDNRASKDFDNCTILWASSLSSAELSLLAGLECFRQVHFCPVSTTFPRNSCFWSNRSSVQSFLGCFSFAVCLLLAQSKSAASLLFTLLHAFSSMAFSLQVCKKWASCCSSEEGIKLASSRRIRRPGTASDKRHARVETGNVFQESSIFLILNIKGLLRPRLTARTLRPASSSTLPLTHHLRKKVSWMPNSAM